MSRSNPTKPHALRRLAILLLGVAACVGDDGAPPAASEDWTRDLLRTELELDLTARTGRATITMARSAGTGASFEVGDLEISGVAGPDGDALEFIAEAGALHIGVPSDEGDATVVITYEFAAHREFDGWDFEAGLTFLWPYFCGNLFPCKPDPAEGQSFALRVTGVPAGMTAVYPADIPADAPSYMPAIAVAAFTEVKLGNTAAGTEVVVWHRAGEVDAAVAGTAHLVDVFGFYEATYGPYMFGDKVGTVSANWGEGAYGGMEHHPYWHVASDSIASEEINAHEAAHGWYGNGVRIGCWEDFVMSEGTASYMAARALASVGVDTWADYACELKGVCEGDGNTVALPPTCGAIDIFNDPIWSSVPYMKGAFFLKAVADEIGADEVDEVIADFYERHAGQAAQMEALVADLAAKLPAHTEAVDALASEWLGTVACPIDAASLCPD